MFTYHIHIGGLVQGVGFRPYVYRLAKKMGLNGWVSNSKDGLHIECNADEKKVQLFYNEILHSPPSNAIITIHTISKVHPKSFSSFAVNVIDTGNKPNLLLTPDFALCNNCLAEIMDKNNKRFGYPFTTCLQCGPRYSIITELPYERHNTTMAGFNMCSECKQEYGDVQSIRHYSQTNTCKACAIVMSMYDVNSNLQSKDVTVILKKIEEYFKEGAIIAVKGIGGYLLLCDATNETTVRLLRQRKHRLAKPFAVLYNTIEKAKDDVIISAEEEAMLKDKAAPILLCRQKAILKSGICTHVIAPGLDKIGVMLPNSPLLHLISLPGKPLIATSANISGSPIIYRDEEAMEILPGIADYIVSYNREIVMPQDDSVMQLTETGKKIILRRSRGLAPNYFINPFNPVTESVLAMGAELKSAFALHSGQNLFISQYLGNQENLPSQTAFTHTVNHFLKLMQTKPAVLLADAHPGYFVTQQAKEWAMIENIPLVNIQHHKAHFAAVLTENELQHTTTPVLGVVWDGTGYGDDKQIWGGEFFIFENGVMQRVAHLEYFPQLLGDKMSREPRLSALSILKFLPSKQIFLQPNFTASEWQYYQQLIKQPPELVTSSMGRFLDAVAALLGICQVNSYEGEAVMKMETLARSFKDPVLEGYPLVLKNHRLDFSIFLQEMMLDIEDKKPVPYIAKKVFYSLALSIKRVSDFFAMEHIALSGGVFQNALLVDMLVNLFKNDKKLYFHQKLSPNDECIGFGQLAYYHSIIKNKQSGFHHVEQNAKD